MEVVSFVSMLVRLGAWVIVLACWLLDCPARAEDAVPTRVRVPIFFMTDRNLVSQSTERGARFGSKRKYIDDCQHDPFLGTGYCVMKNTAGKRLTETLKLLGWAAASRREKEGTVKVTLISGDANSDIQNDFYSKVRNAALDCEHKNILFFAHGYKNPFASAGVTAGRFSYEFESPVVLYSWPSGAKLRSYTSDENNTEWSQEHFNDAMVKMGEVCSQSPLVKLRVFGHSMGSRLVVRGTPFLREKPWVSEVTLICPDIDQGLVKHYTRHYHTNNGTAQVRLYMSQRDRALAISRLLHGGYHRLGQGVDSLTSLVGIDFNLQAGQPGSRSNADAAEMQKQIEQTKKRLQTLDFTELDHGLLGHKIPVELICSMSYTGQPGDGLTLVPEPPKQPSLTSSALSPLTLQPSDTESSDSCLRVHKEKDNKKVASQLHHAGNPSEPGSK
jgi:hypothetical protein